MMYDDVQKWVYDSAVLPPSYFSAHLILVLEIVGIGIRGDLLPGGGFEESPGDAVLNIGLGNLGTSRSQLDLHYLT